MIDNIQNGSESTERETFSKRFRNWIAAPKIYIPIIIIMFIMIPIVLTEIHQVIPADIDETQKINITYSFDFLSGFFSLIGENKISVYAVNFILSSIIGLRLVSMLLKHRIEVKQTEIEKLEIEAGIKGTEIRLREIELEEKKLEHERDYPST